MIALGVVLLVLVALVVGLVRARTARQRRAPGRPAAPLVIAAGLPSVSRSPHRFRGSEGRM